MEMPGGAWRSSIGLAAADADGVVPLSDDRIAIFRYHPQIARLELEMEQLTRAGFEMDALKSSQSDAWGSLDFRKIEIKLYNLISREPASIRDGHVGSH